MKILLVRHGKKDGKGTPQDVDRELSDEGKADVRALARKLKRFGIVPDFYFSSASRHAVDTAKELMSQLGAEAARPVELDTLTPGKDGPDPADVVDALVEEALGNGAEHRTDSVIAVVGHEPRLSQALTRMTSRRVHPLGDAEAVCVAGDDLAAFLQGRGSIQFRTIMTEAPEQQLRSKVASKMTVAALLAGFTATGLIEVVTAEDLTGWETGAAACLSAALSLFVACIFVYDQLSMPEGFWVYGQKPSEPDNEGGRHLRVVTLLRGLERGGARLRDATDSSARKRRAAFKFHDAFKYGGPVYAYMVWTWSFLFVPGLIFAAAGLVLLFVSAGGVLLTALGVAALLVGVAYFVMVQPRLGVD